MSRPKIFISYKRKHEASESLITQLEKEFSEDFELLRDVNMGLSKRWSRELYDWLLNCDAAIVIISKAANKSEWCRREWAVLAARWAISGIPVIPVFVEEKSFKTRILDDIQAAKQLINSPGVIGKIRSALNVIPENCSSAKDFLAAHQAWLYWQFNDAPVFQREPYSLANVYIAPECGQLTWEQIEANKLDPFSEEKDECGGREQLLDTVMGLVADSSFNDLITIQAGPGAGKSAFTLCLANELLKEKFQPIVVRFRDLRFATHTNVPELLDDAIRIGYTDENSPNAKTEIISGLLDESISFKGTELSKTVIILDGWDEVSLTGNTSFKAQLSSWLPRIREYFTEKRGTKVRLILTGRPSAEVTNSGVLRKASSVLTMRPMRPKQLEKFAADITERLQDYQKSLPDDEVNAGWSLDIKPLKPVFEHYQQWFDREDKSNSSNSTGDFLGNPLLAYLSFRVFAETDKSPEELISQPTALYHELINITARNAGKGEDGKLEHTVHRGGDKLRRLLQEVAATISILRTESVSFAELEARFEDSELPIPESLVTDWHCEADTSSALQELVINFYFKGGNTDLGCEFLHKSFREYLFAEAIYHALLDEAEGKEGLFECKSYKYWEEFEPGTPEYRLSRRLSYLLAPQWMSDEVRGHLFWLIENGIAEEPEKWIWIRDLVLSVYAWWAEGVMLRHQPRRSRIGDRWEAPYVDSLFQQVIPFDGGEELAPIRTNTLDAHLGYALLQKTAFIFDKLFHKAEFNSGLSGRSASYVKTDHNVNYFRPGGKGKFLPTLISRIDAEGWKRLPGLAELYLGRTSLEGEILNFIFANEVNLSSTRCFSFQFAYSYLQHASFRSADLSHSVFFRSDLVGANFENAILIGANLDGANLTEANLKNVNLERANLKSANFTNAQLEGVNLRAAIHLDTTIGLPPEILKKFQND